MCNKRQNLIKSQKKYLFILFSLGIILVAFYFTYSYSAWLSVLLIFNWIFLHEKKNYFKKIFFLGTLITLLFFSQLSNNKFSALITFNPRSSLASRIIIWRSALKIIQHNWLIGIGPGNFQKAYLNYQKFYPPYLEWAVPHPQNLYLALWLSSGLIGLSGFFMLLFYWFKDIFLKFKKTHLNIFLITISLILVTLIHGLVDTTYFKNDLAIIFWLNFLALKF
jgi:O-antigen ligase